eukprot:jgi/Tetstr1/428180/TSEL_018231.t1
MAARPTADRSADTAKPSAGGAVDPVKVLAPRQACPQYVVEAVLELAGVSDTDVVYDLGCNDGRNCIRAAADCGARAVGVEILPEAVVKARENALAAGVADRVTILEQDLMEVDVAEATVVMVYLVPKGMQKVAEKLRRELRPGTRIVCYLFSLPGFEPVEERVLRVGNSSMEESAFNKIRLYKVGL